LVSWSFPFHFVFYFEAPSVAWLELVKSATDEPVYIVVLFPGLEQEKTGLRL
jgi:hypothetical protein